MKKFSALLSSIVIVSALSSCAGANMGKSAMAIGEVSQQQLIDNYQHFAQSYQSFKLSTDDLTDIASWPNDLHIEVYFGTWCHDSQREVPRFLKIMSQKPTLSNRLVALDYEKSEPKGSAKHHDIKFTPTFIVYKNNQEVGRIIERPKVSLAADISAML